MSPTGLRASTGTSPGWSDSASSTMASDEAVGSPSGSREHAAVRAAITSNTAIVRQSATGRGQTATGRGQRATGRGVSEGICKVKCGK